MQSLGTIHPFLPTGTIPMIVQIMIKIVTVIYIYTKYPRNFKKSTALCRMVDATRWFPSMSNPFIGALVNCFKTKLAIRQYLEKGGRQRLSNSAFRMEVLKRSNRLETNFTLTSRCSASRQNIYSTAADSVQKITTKTNSPVISWMLK